MLAIAMIVGLVVLVLGAPLIGGYVRSPRRGRAGTSTSDGWFGGWVAGGFDGGGSDGGGSGGCHGFGDGGGGGGGDGGGGGC
jgi:hypothetical protein